MPVYMMNIGQKIVPFAIGWLTVWQQAEFKAASLVKPDTAATHFCFGQLNFEYYGSSGCLQERDITFAPYPPLRFSGETARCST